MKGKSNGSWRLKLAFLISSVRFGEVFEGVLGLSIESCVSSYPACGAAVVFLDVKAFQELVLSETSGMIVAVGDASGITSAIETAFEARERLGDGARRAVEARFSKRMITQRLNEALRKCVPKI